MADYNKDKKVDQAKLSRELLDNYSSSRSNWARQALEDSEFRKGAQWTREQIKELKARRQSPIVVNVIHPTVEQAKALLTANKPRFTVVGREESDIKIGKVMSDLLTYIWDISNGNMELKKAIDDYYVMGLGYLVPYYNPGMDAGKGEIYFKSVSPLEVYIDPNSEDYLFRDAAHIIINKNVSEFQLKEFFPGLDCSKLEHTIGTRSSKISNIRIGTVGQTDEVIDTYHTKYDLIDRYSKKKIVFIRLNDSTTFFEKRLSEEQFATYLEGPAVVEISQGAPPKFTYDDGIKEALARYEQTGGIYHYEQNPLNGETAMVPGPENENSIQGSTIQMQIIQVKDLVENGVLNAVPYTETRILRVISVGNTIISETFLPVDEYPIVPLANHHDRSPYPISDVRLIKELQEAINKTRSLLIAHTANSTNSKWWVPRGSANIKSLEEGFQKSGVFIGEYDPELGIPQQAGPTPLPNELYKSEADYKADIEKIFGLYSFMQGDTSSSPKTYKGTVALDEYGQRRIKSKQHDIESALNHLAKVIIKLSQKYYMEPKVIRIISPNLPAREIAINQVQYNDLGRIVKYMNDITVGEYDVLVVTGSTLPSNRWARFEYYIQLYQQGLIDQEEVLKQTEIVDIEGVLSRFSQMAKMQQQMQSYEEEIKRLSGDLQTSQRESVQDRKRVEVEKFKAKLKVDVNKHDFELRRELLALQNSGKKADFNPPPFVPLSDEGGEDTEQDFMYY